MATASNYTRSVVVASFQANGNEILLFWDFAQNRLVVGNRRFRKNLSVSSAGILEGWADGFKMVPIGYSETSLTNYESTLRKIPAQLRSSLFLFSGQVISVMLPSLLPDRHSEWVGSSHVYE